MQIPFKAEFFDRDYNFMLFSVISEPEISIDYFTLDKSSISIPGLPSISRGWYCRIAQGTDVIYQGTVTSVTQDKSITKVQLLPLIAMFDVQVYRDRTTYTKRNLEQWIGEIIYQNFGDSGDSVQNISGLAIIIDSSTSGIALNLKDNIHDFWTDIAKKAMESGKIAISCSMNPQSKAFDVTIKSFADTPEITLEADLPNVISQNFTFRDDQGSANKCLIINKDNESQQATFYADDYTSPTVWKIETVQVGDDETFSEAAENKASELLKKSDFDNLIELQYRADDKIVPEVEIGQPCRIIKNGVQYHSVLTGIIRKSGQRTLVFGSIRVDLTKILKLKGAL